VRTVIAVFGPTGVGKTAVAIALAERLRARGEDPVAVSADAMQVYDGLPILTGAASPSERAQLEHRLVGFVPITETFSAGAYAAHAHREIDALLDQDRRPIVVGGTGLYLRAALAELDLPPAVGVAERARWERFYDERGAGAALGELERRDPRAASRLHANDRRRVVRALELAERGASLAPERDLLWGSGMRRPALVAVVSWPRAELRARIAARTEAMLGGGALDEVRALRAAGIEPSPTAARILGLAQLGAHLDGDRALAEVAAEITLRTGQYARRQETWARRIPESIELAGADGPERNADRLLELIR